MTFPSITNRGEFFSNHYLDAVIGGGLADMGKAWAEGRSEPSARSTSRTAAAGSSSHGLPPARPLVIGPRKRSAPTTTTC